MSLLQDQLQLLFLPLFSQPLTSRLKIAGKSYPDNMANGIVALKICIMVNSDV